MAEHDDRIEDIHDDLDHSEETSTQDIDHDKVWEEDSVYGPSTVIAALDQIADLVNQARSVPLSASVIVNKAEIVDLVEQAHDALPDDLVAADAVVADADAVLGRADVAAENAIEEAQSRARSILEEAQDIADQLVREAMEEAERLSTRTVEEAESTRAQARSDAERTLTDAKAEMERLISAENITHIAEDRAREIVAKAKATDAQLRRGADEYSMQSLGELSGLLKDLLRRTDAGRRTISERSGIDKTDFNLGDE